MDTIPRSATKLVDYTPDSVLGVVTIFCTHYAPQVEASVKTFNGISHDNQVVTIISEFVIVRITVMTIDSMVFIEADWIVDVYHPK